MAPQDTATRSAEEPDDSLVEESTQPDQNDLTSEMVSTNEDEWAATAEGYTPLADLGGGEAAMFMAFPPSMDDDDEDGSSGGGVFFADLGAFGATSVDEPDEDGERDAATELVEREAGAQSDFRALADQALSSLENEYNLTLRGERQAPSTANNGTNSIAHEATSDAGSQCVNPVTASVSSFDQRELPPIDAEAVRRAVASIRIKAPDLTTNLDKGSEMQKEQVSLAPRHHDVIPSTPLAAFRRRSPKAVRATANLSRSATLAEALCRLSCLDACKKSLEIHVVGADPVECETDERVRTLFGPLVRWVGALTQSPAHISIHLVGPNLASPSRPTVDLMPSSTSIKKSLSPLKSASASFFCGCYHEWMAQKDHGPESAKWQKPDVAVAFNAGVWGYDEWRPTLQALCAASESVPFVITSYTIQEGEDDADVVEHVLAAQADSTTQKRCRQCLWRPESNPFRSKVKRETVTAIEGREYHENAAWQAWLLGGINDNTYR